MNKRLYVIAAVIAVILILIMARDTMIESTLKKGVKRLTGLSMRIQRFRTGVFKPYVDIKDLVLYNPKGFKDRVMADVPEIYIYYDLPYMFKGRHHFYEMRLELQELLVVRNENSELNLNALKSLKDQRSGAAEKQERKPLKLDIDYLHLKIGKVIYKDYSKGGAPAVKEFNIGLDESYTGVDDPYELVNLIIVKAIRKTTIAQLTGFDLQSLQDSLSVAVSAGKKTIKTVAVAAEDTLKDTTKVLKEAIKLPFKKTEK